MKRGRHKRETHSAPGDLFAAYCERCGEVGGAVEPGDVAMLVDTVCPTCSTPLERGGRTDYAIHIYRRSGLLGVPPAALTGDPERLAAVVLLEDAEARLLSVWNLRYAGWTLPGGKVDEGETVEAAAARELFEETGAKLTACRRVYDAGHILAVAPTRGRYVHVVRGAIELPWVPVAESRSQPLAWFTREEFLRFCPFAEFYRRCFAAVPPKPNEALAPGLTCPK
jgi:8-oxo-dGTP pyrophosphatase MutT (NUDIX family)